MNKPERVEQDTAKLMHGIGTAARAAARELALASNDKKNAALIAAAKAIRAAAPAILAANAKDVAAMQSGDRPQSFVDRLLLNDKRIEAIAKGLEDVATLADPVGTVLAYGPAPTASSSSASVCRWASSASSMRAGRT